MKGIILAGGSGTRLFPVTQVISKQILPVYDKPMIYYPLSILMLAGIRDILIISTPRDITFFKDLLGDGKHLGLKFQYEIQEKPNGLAEAFIIGEKFIGNDNVTLILGDNILYGESLPEILKVSIKNNKGASIFGYYVDNPSEYGVVEFDNNFNVISIAEKPKNPKSNYAIPGLYIYDNEVIAIAKSIKPSERGELEITDVNKVYLSKNKLNVTILGRGIAWLDSGTVEDLQEAASFIRVIEKRQGLKIACIEEIAYKMGYINREELRLFAEKFSKSQYGKYLFKILNMEQKK
ncbi:MAG TPA: glucose-1-phosphate thymidylyltransferase RfbA [Spirochaetota bacterium]|nr:glucose-1-phosphate thymidylyltransferase RfbA [Spirochaetota bacterium]HOL58145.1 glucose-1-phosphate thymidylyltransferase RfbA [Spirochaetota bacterium]HPP05592.1 glucose-1-phosphate thymidylyltransferase RfbA [Spirochaetota bacterium]